MKHATCADCDTKGLQSPITRREGTGSHPPQPDREARAEQGSRHEAQQQRRARAGHPPGEREGARERGGRGASYKKRYLAGGGRSWPGVPSIRWFSFPKPFDFFLPSSAGDACAGICKFSYHCGRDGTTLRAVVETAKEPHAVRGVDWCPSHHDAVPRGELRVSRAED